MRWRWLWPWAPTGDEAARHLAVVRAQDAEVARLGAELARIRQANHFSELVASAIARCAPGGGGDDR